MRAEARHSWLQLAREAAEAKEAASALAEENQALIAKVQRLVPPPDRAGSSASDSRDGSPTKVHHQNRYEQASFAPITQQSATTCSSGRCCGCGSWCCCQGCAGRCAGLAPVKARQKLLLRDY